MTAPTSPWNIPLFAPGDTIPSLEGVLNSVSTALNTALSSAQVGFYLRYTTLALMNANTTAAIGQHATVYADGITVNNGDYVRTATAWILCAQDTGWVPLVAASGVTLAGGNARILNQVLYLQGSASRTSNWTAGQNVATLPASLLPLAALAMQKIVSFGSGNLGVINVAAGTGTISLGIASGTTSLTMSLNIGSPVN